MNTRNYAIGASQRAAYDYGLIWQRTLAALALGVLVLLGIYFDAFAEMVSVWARSSNHQVSWLVLPIAIYFVWQRRGQVSRLQPEPGFIWVAGAIPFALLWLVSEAAHVSIGVQAAAIGMVQVLLLALLGTTVFRALLFPFLFLWLMVPFGDSLIPVLQDMTVVLTVDGLRLTGMDVQTEGNVLITGSWAYAIVEECTSLDFIIGNLFIGLVFSNLIYTSNVKRTLYVCASIVIAIIANIIRTTSVVWLTYHTDGSINLADDHLAYGWIIFVAAVVVQMLVGFCFRDSRVPPAESTPANQSVGPATLVPVWFAAMAAFAAAPLYATLAFARAPLEHPLCFPPLPTAFNPVAYGADWRVEYVGATAELYRTADTGTGPVDLLVSYYWHQDRRSELVSASNRVYDRERWKFLQRDTVVLRIDGQQMPVTRERLRAEGARRRLVWHWYWVDGQFTASAQLARLLQARATLLGGDSRAALLALSIEESTASGQPEARIQGLLDAAPFLRHVLDKVRPVADGDACAGLVAAR